MISHTLQLAKVFVRIYKPTDVKIHKDTGGFWGEIFSGKRNIQVDTKKRELLKNPTKIEEIQEKKLLTEIEPLKLAF